MPELTEQDVQTKVIQIVGDTMGRYAADLNRGTRIAEDLEADSLDTVEMLMAAEDAFGLPLHDHDAETWKTLGDVIDHLWSRRQELNVR